MNKLPLKLFRDIKESKGQFIAIILVIAVGAFFYAGLIPISIGLSAYTEVYFKEHNLSDLNVHYSEIFEEDITTLEKIEGINKIEGRYTFYGVQVFDGYKSTLKIHSIPTDNRINTVAVTEGKVPSNKDEILLDARYALEHNFSIGDRIAVSVYDENFQFIISGFGENVEHTFNIQDPALVLPDHRTYGAAYMSEERISAIAGSLYYNELIIDVKDNYSTEVISKEIEEQSQDLSYLYQINKERDVSYSAINVTINNNRMMSTVSPLILFMVAAITIFLTMSRLIDSQRNQIGIMKALGVKDKNIILHYIGYPIITGVLGSIIGWCIAAVTFLPTMNAIIEQTYSLPDCNLSVDLYTMFPPMIVSILFGVVACYLSGRTILNERAAQAMRPKPPKKMKKVLIEKIPAIWNKIPYGFKLILRNIFLNKQKAITSSIGVVVCAILLITAFGFESSMQYIANQINYVYTYDFKVDYKTKILTDTLKLPTGVTNYFLISTIPIEIEKFNEDIDATLIVMEDQSNLIHFYDEDNNQITLDQSGLLVPKSYADNYNISQGDILKLRFITPELRGKAVEMKVSKISTQYTSPSFYCTPEYLQSFGIGFDPTSLLVGVDNMDALKSVRDSFESDISVDLISDKDDTKKSVDNMIEQNNAVFIIFIFCAVILSFGAMYTISSINIYERTRELATLKVLGYQKRKIHGIIFIENMILTTLAVIVALPISGYVYRLVVKALSSSNQLIPNRLNMGTIILSILITFLLTIISNFLLRGKVNKIDMIESLKSVE